MTALTLTAAGATVAPATAAAPVTERIQIDDTFTDEGLSEACGVDVMTTAKGFFTIRTIERTGAGPTSVFTINIGLTSTAGDNTVRFRDVGADIARITPEGDVIILVAGQVPFGFKGALRFNPETGEVLNEPRDISEEQLEQICAALTAA